MKDDSNKSEKPKISCYLMAIAIAIFLSFSIWSALTTRPESDEGSFASPAFNLAFQGHFGTTVFESEGQTLTRIEQRTYWVLPLFLLNASASFKIFGFSLFSLRAVSIFWGLVLIIAWYFIILKVSGDRLKAAICALFLSGSYVVLVNASIGRGDTMCASLGFAALAVYLWLRERNLLLAVFLSQFLVMLSGLTHFLGILSFAGLLFLTLYYDWRLIRFRHVLIAAVPYIVGGGLFGLWVLQDFEAFKDQFITNALMSGRMEGFSSPVNGLIREFTLRYPRAFGLLESSAGHTGPIFLKSLMLVGYVLGILGVVFSRELRRKYWILLVLTALYFFIMALIDGQKLAVYLIYIVPVYTSLLVLWLCYIWEKRRLPRPLILLGASGFLLLGIGGVALRCRQDTLGNFHKPAIEFLNQNVGQDELVMGAPQIRFYLSPHIRHISDGTFGLRSGKRPKYIVYDPGVEDSWKDSKIYNPEFYEYFPRLLGQEYKVAYQNAAYKIYVRR
jgi:4-amino-4-deoxy-L-arabinose transferase-like glycosyltransferase